MMSRKNTKTKQAFTLIELLLVISIIALLMAIMLPALQKVRKQAKYTVCMSNQKQALTAFLTYAESYDGKLPDRIGGHRKEATGFDGGMWSYSDTLMDGLKPYLGDSMDVLSCRNSNSPWATPVQFYREYYNDNSGSAVSRIWFTSNAYLVGMGSPEFKPYWMDTSKKPYCAADVKLAKNNSNKLVLVDLTVHSRTEGWAIINHPKSGIDQFGDVFDDYGPFLGSKGLREMTEHPEGGNRAHVDGSVESVKRGKMSTNDSSLDKVPLGHMKLGALTYFW